jgi:hypothetical protein
MVYFFFFTITYFLCTPFSASSTNWIITMSFWHQFLTILCQHFLISDSDIEKKRKKFFILIINIIFFI